MGSVAEAALTAPSLGTVPAPERHGQQRVMQLLLSPPRCPWGRLGRHLLREALLCSGLTEGWRAASRAERLLSACGVARRPPSRPRVVGTEAVTQLERETRLKGKDSRWEPALTQGNHACLF